MLRDSSLVDCDEKSRRTYLLQNNRREKLGEFLRARAGHLKTNVPGSVSAILDKINIRASQKVIKSLAPHICILRFADFEDANISLPDIAKPVVSWWRRYTAIGIPCWEGVDLCGFWLVTVKGHRYLPLGDVRRVPAGFAQVPSMTDELAVVVDDPVAALRLTIWSAINNSTPTGFICPYGLRDNTEDYKCGRTVFWSPTGELEHYLRALNTPDATILDHAYFEGLDIQREFPCKGAWGPFRYQAVNALPSHQAIALHLLGMKITDARPRLANQTIDSGDRAKILTYVKGEDAKFIETMFTNSMREEAVSWNGSTITDTNEGWVVKGKIISAAKLHLEQLRPQGETGEAVVTGTISYRSPGGDRINFPFKDYLSKIVKNTGEWLQEKVRVKAGYHPYVERAWTRKLFEVAQQFQVPTPVMADQVYGWSDGKLRMPNFVVDNTSVYANRSMVEGPGIQLPAPLTPGEWDAFKSPGFCRVVLALLGNLLRTRNDRNGIGIMLTNEPHMVSRLAQALGADVRVNPTAFDIDEHGSDPLPLFTEWSDYRLAEMFDAGTGYRNIVLNVESRTARLARLHANWLQLSIGEAIDYSALRQLFGMLPRLLRCSELNLDGESFYRDIADVIKDEVAEKCRGHRLNNAAVTLDTHNTYRGSTAATRILELIFYGIEREEIKPDYRDEEIVIKKAEFITAVSSPIVPPPSLGEISQRLEDARFLMRESEDEWQFSRLAWDINASLAGLSQQ